jgi:hypothetical protein
LVSTASSNSPDDLNDDTLANSPASSSSSEPLSPTLTLPVLRLGVNEAIERLGFGPFQALLLFLCGCVYIADSMEIMLLSFLSRTLTCEWLLAEWQGTSLSTGTIARDESVWFIVILFISFMSIYSIFLYCGLLF